MGPFRLGDSLVGELARTVDVAARLGAFDPFLTAARTTAVARWGAGISAMVAGNATRFPNRIAIADADGEINYATVDRHASNVGCHLRRLVGDRAGNGAVGILCRNHRGFLVAQIAAERAGADLVLLSTALPAPKLAEVAEREQLAVLVVDEEFRAVVEAAGLDLEVVAAEGDGPGSLADLATSPGTCPAPRRRSRLVLLTSGTTGPPKGARRHNQAPGPEVLGMFAQVPYRLGDQYLVGPPLFHAWGLSQATTALATASTVHLRPRFDVDETLSILRQRPIDVLAVVPLMLRRLLRAATDRADIQAPRLVLSSGNVLSGDLALEWMDAFGDRLYNFYGSTETAIGTIALPADLRHAPGTVGRPPRGVTIGILDHENMPVPAGTLGRVHLASRMQFAGYTDGTDRERAGTLMATGDLGYFDVDGLLHVEGRVNDMIVTGGENVFPSRVEEVLEQNPDVEMAAVVGVDDEDYGQRVVAFVVPRPKATIDVTDLLAGAALELQSFKVPREVRIVDSLPMTTTGKVVRHRLAVLGEAERV
ncbi:MAG: AMP-binding protein [Actinomycetia bacterium]|nr:AMP-binding protein [Actinomycetes bacterium]